MADKFCTGCGAPLRPDMAICPRCGKVTSTGGPAVSSQRRAVSANAAARRPVNRTSAQPQRRAAAYGGERQRPTPPRPAPPVYEERRQSAKTESGGKSGKKKLVHLIFRLATIAVVLAAAYIAISAVQVFRVKISSFDFKTEMKLSCKNYGEAIDGYFESGKWSVNPITGTCTYKGETKDSSEYEIVFTARLSVKVDSISVDGKKVNDKQIETRMMSMFI